MATTLERVQAGAAFLDEKWGSKEWREKIEVEELDMAHANECVLGQVYGDYHVACRKLEIFGYSQRENLGFTIPEPIPFTEDAAYREWDALERTWTAYLKGEMSNVSVSR